MTRGSLELLRLDRIIPEPARLLILTALYPVARMEYLRLQREWKFKQGSLSSHLAVLEKAGYVAIEKGFKGKYPQTWCPDDQKGARGFRTVCVRPKRFLDVPFVTARFLFFRRERFRLAAQSRSACNSQTRALKIRTLR
jgi:DNA-binding transcriptional ArsR family regulator